MAKKNIRTALSADAIKKIMAEFDLKITKEQNILLTLLVESFIVKLVDDCKKPFSAARIRKLVHKRGYFFLDHLFQEPNTKK